MISVVLGSISLNCSVHLSLLFCLAMSAFVGSCMCVVCVCVCVRAWTCWCRTECGGEPILTSYPTALHPFGKDVSPPTLLQTPPGSPPHTVIRHAWLAGPRVPVGAQGCPSVTLLEAVFFHSRTQKSLVTSLCPRKPSVSYSKSNYPVVQYRHVLC